MKFLVVFAAAVAVAVAGPTHRLVEAGIAGAAPIIIEPEQPISVGPTIVDGTHPISVGPAIVDGTHPISVGPAIVDGTHPISVGPAIVDGTHPISVGPAIVDGTQPISVGPAIIDSFEPIAVGPAIIDFPLPDGGSLTEVPAPVVVAPVHKPRVSMTININPAALGSNLVAVEGLPAVSAPIAPEAVSVVDTAPESVSVVDVAPEVVSVVDMAPVVVNPVIVQPAPSPVIVVDNTPSAPITVVDNAPPSPISVVDTVLSPVTVVETAPESVVEINPAPIAVGPALVDSETTSENGVTNVTNNFLVNVILNFIQGAKPESPVQVEGPIQSVIPVFPDAVSVVNN